MSASRCSNPVQILFNVRREEIAPVLIAALFFFCVMAALMVLRPARDALGMEHGMESMRRLIIVTAVATLAMYPLFGLLVGRLKRLQLVGTTYGFFALSLAGFWALMTFAPLAIGHVSGQAFYVWFNVFNLFVTMVFWALLTERFTNDQSKRFFSLISIGGTLGAIFGPWLSSLLAQSLGTPSLLLVAGGLLLLGLLAAWLLLWTAPGRATGIGISTSARADEAAERIGGDAFAGIRSVFRTPYLSGIATYVMLMAVMATFVYFTRLQMVAAIAVEIDTRTAILARIDMWTHVAVLALQLTFAGPIIRRFGLGIVLAILPVATAIGFIGLAVHGSFAVLVLLEAATRAVQRGITQPAREALFTVIDREDKYRAKAFIDTSVYRGGDMVGSQAEGALGRLGLAMGGLVNVVLPVALVWVLLALWLGRAQVLRAARLPASAAPGGFDGAQDDSIRLQAHSLALHDGKAAIHVDQAPSASGMTAVREQQSEQGQMAIQRR
jgi:AAA family ATP:ADP antiporter